MIRQLVVENVSSAGYTVRAVIEAPAGVKEVLMPTWTEANGQDDLIWHRASVSGNTATFTVRKAEHKGEAGRYITHVYLYDNAGGVDLKGTTASVGQ